MCLSLGLDDLVISDSTEIMKHLNTVVGPRAAIKLILTGVQGQKVVTFQQMLDDLPVGFLTYGLAFHQSRTKVVRFPYSEEDFLDKARNLILTRGDKLAIATASIGPENETAKLELTSDEEIGGIPGVSWTNSWTLLSCTSRPWSQETWTRCPP